MKERRTIAFPHVPDVEHPAFELRGARDGPRVSLIGGIHGCEYSSIAAVTRFANELEHKPIQFLNETGRTIRSIPMNPAMTNAQRGRVKRSFRNQQAISVTRIGAV